IRRELLTASMRGLEDRPKLPLSRTSYALTLLISYIDLLRQQGTSDDPTFTEKVARHLVELAVFALEPTPETKAQASSTVRQARLATIRADVLDNLSQVRLSAKTVARRHGFTDRYIHLLFEETGETFGKFVMEERLKRAFNLLADPQQSSRRISDIASEAG